MYNLTDDSEQEFILDEHIITSHRETLGVAVDHP